ncbi:AMP-binding protein [Pseudalkalibacillus sp. Hm43]|uniref:AMP-binding protein n=1 Tax=Pseudalkalibacillus sp. Hm43 TaxID=3450742 RepID=UPI003F426399
MIFDRIKRQAQLHPMAVAVQTEAGEWMYGELVLETEKAANHIYSRAPFSSGRLAIYFSKNSPDFLTYFLAAVSIGWTAVPIDPKLPSDKVRDILIDSEPDVLVTDISEEKVKELWEGEIVTPNARNVSYEKRALPVASPESLFYLGYTSGTSGKPKGFLRTQHSWTESFDHTDHEYTVAQGDEVVITGSLVHSLFLYGTVHALASGATVSILDRYSATGVASRIHPSVKTIVYVVPTMLESLLSESFEAWNWVDCIISSGSKWNAKRRGKVEETFSNAECIEFYGASELSFVSILHQKDAEKKSDSVGRPFTGVEVSIRNEQFEEVQRGEVGMLYVKSDMIFEQYLNLPEKTEEVRKGDWATVGDMARMDEDGFIYLVGRANQMIITGGLNVFPEEVERIILTCPSIQEVVVVGIPDTYWGEKIVAFVQWQSGFAGNDEEVRQICRDLLPKYKCPKEYVTVKVFPYTVSQKIARNQLVEQFVQGGIR